MLVVKMTIFDDKAQIWPRDTSFWSKLNVNYEIIGFTRNRYSRDDLAPKIYFSKIFQNDVIVTGSHQNPLIRQGTLLVVYNKVIRTKNQIVRVSLKVNNLLLSGFSACFKIAWAGARREKWIREPIVWNRDVTNSPDDQKITCSE